MDRRGRNDLFERLVIYRRVYRMRTEYDTEPVLTVKAAIAYVERVMRAAAATAPPAPAA